MASLGYLLKGVDLSNFYGIYDAFTYLFFLKDPGMSTGRLFGNFFVAGTLWMCSFFLFLGATMKC